MKERAPIILATLAGTILAQIGTMVGSEQLFAFGIGLGVTCCLVWGWLLFRSDKQ